jgi:starch synthase (maltosyl-transferring)
VCTTDPHAVRDGWIHLRLEELGLHGQQGFEVSDLLSGSNYEWGEHNYVKLSPDQVAHIFVVHPHS